MSIQNRKKVKKEQNLYFAVPVAAETPIPLPYFNLYCGPVLIWIMILFQCGSRSYFKLYCSPVFGDIAALSPLSRQVYQALFFGKAKKINYCWSVPFFLKLRALLRVKSISWRIFIVMLSRSSRIDLFISSS